MNDRVLDMCAAPGGKALITLQSLMPTLIVANDIQESRTKRICHFYNEFIGNISDWQNRFIITTSDARSIKDKDIYNKVQLFKFNNIP
jgi:16S rRNA C967 or C1407 C5-methylase (RsmB/RsmF family)